MKLEKFLCIFNVNKSFFVKFTNLDTDNNVRRKYLCLFGLSIYLCVVSLYYHFQLIMVNVQDHGTSHSQDFDFWYILAYKLVKTGMLYDVLGLLKVMLYRLYATRGQPTCACKFL